MARASSKLSPKWNSSAGMSYSAPATVTTCCPLHNGPYRLSIKARPRNSVISRLPFRRPRARPLEYQVHPDGAISHAFLIRRNQGGRAHQFPPVAARPIDPCLQPADHPLRRFREDNHAIEVLPLHCLTPIRHPSSYRARGARLFRPCGHAMVGQPIGYRPEHFGIEFEVAVVEPAREVAN